MTFAYYSNSTTKTFHCEVVLQQGSQETKYDFNKTFCCSFSKCTQCFTMEDALACPTKEALTISRQAYSYATVAQW